MTLQNFSITIHLTKRLQMSMANGPLTQKWTLINCVDQDYMLHPRASHQGLQCLASFKFYKATEIY